MGSSKPPLVKLFASLLYDALVLIALCFLLGGLFVFFAGDATSGSKRYALQFFLWISVGIYFVRCWTKSGQTLAMHTWHLKLVNSSTLQLPTIAIGILRYMLATLSLMLFGLGFLWALFDTDKCYLHDRLLKLRIITRD